MSFARTLERAAAWSASVQFAQEMASSDYVPEAYFQNLIAAGAQELEAIAKQVDDHRGVDPQARSRASADCRRLRTILEDAGRVYSTPDAAALRSIETDLRNAARRARSGARARAAR